MRRERESESEGEEGRKLTDYNGFMRDLLDTL